MIALFLKELRALLPFAILCALNSADIVTRPFSERLDEQTWLGIASYIESSDGSLGYALAILTTIVAYAAFPREHDDRTIEFLYGLPVHRVQIFGAKVAAGVTVVCFGLASLVVTDGIQSTLNPQSLSGGQWRLDLALTFFAIQAVFCAIIYAHALLASVFRLFGVIPYVLGLFVIAIADDALPWLASTDPTAMLAVQYDGTDLVIPWEPIIGHAIVGCGALALAYAAWMGPADRIARVLEGAKESAVSKGLVGCGAALGIAFLGVMAIGLVAGLGDEEGETNLGVYETAEHPTARYLFTYPTSHRERALALIEAADPIHEQIQARLGTDPGPQLVADLTEVSGDHLGIASWTHVRVGIVSEPNLIRCQRTFAHETVHAFQHRLTDRRQSDSSATRFFSEGSAEYLAYVIVPGDAELRHARIMGAVAWSRHRMTLDDLIDDDRLHARFDTALVYSLGELWTAALVEAHGERAIGDVLRALGRPDAPRDLGPRALWDDTLRAAGCDLSTVNVAFERSLRRIADDERTVIDTLPRIGGAVAGREGGDVRIIAELDRDPQPGWKYLVRLRRGPDSSDTEAFGVEGFASGRRVVFRVPSEIVPGRRFQIMFSIQTVPDGWAWSETWQWASAPR